MRETRSGAMLLRSSTIALKPPASSDKSVTSDACSMPDQDFAVRVEEL
jgi:hypothetical protein